MLRFVLQSECLCRRVQSLWSDGNWSLLDGISALNFGKIRCLLFLFAFLEIIRFLRVCLSMFSILLYN